jgi:eukaryotic-like serine/threonine-protein kinase
MSTVFLAHRADGQFERSVAIKFLHGIMPGKKMHSRLLAEQRILAKLEHKNIARLFDSGLTDNRRPYFILEYVEGLPVHTYCLSNKLSVKQKLQIFEQICEAVQFAHQRLIVHRDLKPNNILVKNDGTVKLLDFGIAKILEEDTPGVMPVTRTGVYLMTPEYASPEQINGENITTATDVYSLGLLLCQILTGRLPYDVSKKNPLEIGYIINAAQPTRPSHLVTHKTDKTGDIDFPDYNLNLKSLRRELKGDLDNIILKALRKEPERRYNSAEQLLNDLQNYQKNLPVSARPETPGYRARKFIQRHRIGFAASVIVLLSLITTAAVSNWQAEQARSERDRTIQINDFLQTILMEADPYTAGSDATVRDVLRKAGELVHDRFPDQPELEAPLRYTIGYAQLGLMELDDSYDNLTISKKLYEQLYGNSDSRTLTSSSYLAWLEFRRGNYEMAIQGYMEVINQIDQRTQWDTKATILNDYAVILLELERYHEALDLQLIVLELWMDNDPSRSEVAIIHNNIAQTYHGIEEFELAEENYLTSLTMLMEFFPDGNHPDISSTLNNLGVLLRDQGNYEEAIRYYREALDIRRATLGESHPNTAFSHLNLSRMLLELDRVEEARPHSQIAVDIMSEALNDTHLHLLVARSTLARIYTKDGRYVEAESILSDVVAIMDKEFVPAWIIEQAQQWLTEARELNPD